MIFDLFHSISDPIVNGVALGPKRVFEGFLKQVELAESLGMDTVWCAESHFSSETQKKTSDATIPQFFGEVGLNSDSFQLIHWLRSRTKRIHLGTGIHNIVGGSGGPIASADRVNTLHFMNRSLWEDPRRLRIGFASGRFTYQNSPFGIQPRDEMERDLWPLIRRYAFIEAVEIFLRLLKGETVSSQTVTQRVISADEVDTQFKEKASALKSRYAFPLPIKPRWNFESLTLVPSTPSKEGLDLVLGSSDPLALETAYRFWNVDLFNLSFTPPEQIEKLHEKMTALNQRTGGVWHRSRLPRTVLVFIDRNPEKATALAHQALDTYVEAMRGTAQVPDKAILLQRALVGDAAMIREQLSPANPRRFHADDRLMLWFEFNQLDCEAILSQMRYFFDEVASKL